MIRSLSIRNYAIIDHLEIQFDENLTIITGETGAGKSIILGALGLILGNRADSKVLYDQNAKCVVEATCFIGDYTLQPFFEEEGLEYEQETIIRREISTAGKSRAFINDSPVKLGTLEKLGAYLIDLHQQFDTLDIQQSRFQLEVIDALAQHSELLKNYQNDYKVYETSKKELKKLTEQAQKSAQESDFIQYQLQELQKANLQPQEQEELEQLQKQLANAEEIKSALSSATRQLTEDENSLYSQLADIVRSIETVAEFYPTLPVLSERLENAKFELEDISSELEQIAENTEYDGKRLEEIDERLNLLFRLCKKYNVVTVEDLIALQTELQDKLRSFSDTSAQIANLEKIIASQEKSLKSQAVILSQNRQKAAQPFENTVHNLLTQLSMPHARLVVEIKTSIQLNNMGMDELQFLFAANKGSRPEPIKNVASGGELSRLALCIKSLVADAITLPTLIFDEIDSGVSGEVAFQMALILQSLSQNHQVISITHSPQIAAKANTHFFVHKIVQENRTTTGIRTLSTDERIIEIAKMLSGNPPTEIAKANAKELLAR